MENERTLQNLDKWIDELTLGEINLLEREIEAERKRREKPELKGGQDTKSNAISQDNKNTIGNFVSALEQELNILVDDLTLDELDTIQTQFIMAGYSEHQNVMKRLDRLINKKRIKEALFCINYLEALHYSDSLEVLNEPDKLGKPKIESVLNIIDIGDEYGIDVFESAEEIGKMLIYFIE